MQILLLNTNPVVSRLISLCLKDKEAKLHEVSSFDEIESKHYDLALIDDAAYQNVNHDALQSLSISKLVLLSSQATQTDEMIDEVIKKPFLPSKIIEMIESLENVEPAIEPLIEDKTTEVSTDVPHIFPLSAAEEEEVEDVEELNIPQEIEENEERLEILNITEIEKIKSLLEMGDEDDEHEDLIYKDEDELESLKREVIKQNLIEEGLEIVEEEDVIEVVEKDLTLHISHDKHTSDKKREKFEKKLLGAIKEMKLKKLQKLLKGAEVTINIHFKDSQK